jgi:hypothetical protein
LIGREGAEHADLAVGDVFDLGDGLAAGEVLDLSHDVLLVDDVWERRKNPTRGAGVTLEHASERRSPAREHARHLARLGDHPRTGPAGGAVGTSRTQVRAAPCHGA